MPADSLPAVSDSPTSNAAGPTVPGAAGVASSKHAACPAPPAASSTAGCPGCQPAQPDAPAYTAGSRAAVAMDPRQPSPLQQAASPQGHTTPATASFGTAEPVASIAEGPGAGGPGSGPPSPAASQQRRGPEGAREPAVKSCMGLLYFSQFLHDHRKAPVCSGLRRRREGVDSRSIQSEAVPGGDFKYLCVGYSMFDEAAMRGRGQAVAGKRSPTDPVELPYCEGLEVISAAELHQNPLLMKDGPDLPPAAPSSSQPVSEGTARPPRRGLLPGPPEGAINWEEFPARFKNTAGKILEKMGSNAAHIVNTFKRALSDVGKGE